MNDNDLSSEISSCLLDLGISANLRGFTYLEDSVYNIINKKENIINIKNLYDKLAIKYNTTSYNVERDIRYAIDKGEKNEDYEVAYTIFRNSLDIKTNKKTNKIFIMTLANYIKHETYNHY